MTAYHAITRTSERKNLIKETMHQQLYGMIRNYMYIETLEQNETERRTQMVRVTMQILWRRENKLVRGDRRRRMNLQT